MASIIAKNIILNKKNRYYTFIHFTRDKTSIAKTINILKTYLKKLEIKVIAI